jgi:hypothetical protein
MANQTAFSPDTSPPSVAVSAPTANTQVSGRVRVIASVTDDWGVADAVLSVDGIEVAVDDRMPYEFLLDTTTFSPGIHELAVVATDTAGNASAPRPFKVTFGSSTGTGAVGRNSTITFRSPRAGATVAGDVLIEATVTDPDGLAAAEWWIDGSPVYTSAISGTTTGVNYLWYGSGVANGEHTIVVNVIDANGTRQTANLVLRR